MRKALEGTTRRWVREKHAIYAFLWDTAHLHNKGYAGGEGGERWCVFIAK